MVCGNVGDSLYTRSAIAVTYNERTLWIPLAMLFAVILTLSLVLLRWARPGCW